MKIRNGFVSNSSSSSFIIAFKDSKPCKHCGRKDPNIINAIESISAYDDENEVHAIGRDVIGRLGEHGWYNQEEEKKLVEAVTKHLKSGYTVASISISYHNEMLNNLLDNMVESDNVVILEDTEGKYLKRQ